MNLGFLALLLISTFRAEPSHAAICLKGVCVGDKIIQTYNSLWAKVSAINFNQKTYALVSLDGRQMGNVAYDYIGQTKSGICLNSICTGEKVVQTYNHLEAYVAAINLSANSYALAGRDQDKRLMGNVAIDYIGRTVPGFCHNSFCVGDKVTQTYNSLQAVIIAINTVTNCYSLADAPGGRMMGCVAKDYLALRERSKDAAERQRREREEKEAIDLSNQGLIEIAAYKQARKAGRSHKEAIEDSMGPVFIGLEQTEKFLARLAAHVYGFDATYFQDMAKQITADNLDRTRAFVVAALLPHLRAFGYTELKKKYIDTTVQRIEAALAKKNIRALKDMESTPLTKKISVFLLASSLQTAMPQLQEEQKPRASAILAVLGETAAKNGNYGFKDMEPLLKLIPEYRALLSTVAQNLYFTGRVATDLQLLDYLENQ